MGDAELGRRMQRLLKTCCKTLYEKTNFYMFYEKYLLLLCYSE